MARQSKNARALAPPIAAQTETLSPFMAGGGRAPSYDSGMTFRQYGQSGLKQYAGYVREEFLPQLGGVWGLQTYREMLDNNATVGSIVFAIQAIMRQVEWRAEPANDSPAAQAEADFLESLMVDMSHSWEDFVSEALSMLGYGFAPHEIVYKRRMGAQDINGKTPRSKFNDGLIGWRKIPLRAQDTISKWYFSEDGGIDGLQQMPFNGVMTDIPIQKLLLFRPTQHKNNPEGRSILRTAYRNWFFIKRMENQEAIMFERMSGLPVMTVPLDLLNAAQGADPDPQAVAALARFNQIVQNVRIDEQMGMVLPSDCYATATGISNTPMYGFKLLTPDGTSGARQDWGATIKRHEGNILTSTLTDFLLLGHDVRGANNLAVTKVDLFMMAVEGYLNGMAGVLNEHAIPRLWALNNKNPDLMPNIKPDMARRADMDGLGTFVEKMANAGMRLFPDDALESYIRDTVGFPDISEEASMLRDKDLTDALAAPGPEELAAQAQQALAAGGKPPGGPLESDSPPERFQKILRASIARRQYRLRKGI